MSILYALLMKVAISFILEVMTICVRWSSSYLALEEVLKSQGLLPKDLIEDTSWVNDKITELTGSIGLWNYGKSHYSYFFL